MCCLRQLDTMHLIATSFLLYTCILAVAWCVVLPSKHAHKEGLVQSEDPTGNGVLSFAEPHSVIQLATCRGLHKRTLGSGSPGCSPAHGPWHCHPAQGPSAAQAPERPAAQGRHWSPAQGRCSAVALPPHCPAHSCSSLLPCRAAHSGDLLAETVNLVILQCRVT